MQEEDERELPQLRINRIILDNFKSYYGHLEIGPFHKQFTSIVGPNGSGKSNLIESLLFVFGKKASWMRLQKIHQLIHNSAKHNDVKKASVEVQFEEKGGNEIRLKRTVHHTGQSNYEINGKHVTLEEVTTLLKSKGIDLTNNRFLILQGEVEQISLMKPKSGDADKPGLLEYLEDIVGSNKYQEQIEHLSEEYLVLDGQRREKGEMMRVVEMDLEKLEPGKDRAVEFVRRELKHMQLQNVQQQIQNYKSGSQIQKLKDQHSLLNEKLSQSMKDSQEKIRENQDVLQQYKEAKRNLDKEKELINKIKGQIEEVNLRDQQYRSENSLISEQQTKIQKTLGEITQDRSKCIDDQQDLEQELPQKRQKLEELNKQRIELEQIVEELTQKNNDQIKQLLDEKNRIQNLLHEPLKLRQKLIKNIETLKNRIIKPQEQENAKGLIKSLDECNVSISELEKLLKTLNDALGEIKVRSQNTSNKEAEMGKKLRIINETISDYQNQLDGRNMAQNQINEQNHIIKAILSASSSGQLKGVIGKIGDLAYIDPKYDIAVSTACGGLNAILVENQQAAEQCVQFLRQNRIGRHTFMSLDVITRQMTNEMNRQFKVPQQTQRLFDLIQLKKEEYRPVLYKVMTNTLVCDNIELAKDLRFNQKLINRYVTLDGKLVEANGLMSGGGQPKRGGMNTTAKVEISKNDQENIEFKVKELQQEKAGLEQELMRIKYELSTLHKDNSILQEQLRQRKIQLQEQNDLQQDLNQKIIRQKQLEEQRIEKEKERKELEKQILDLEQQIKEIDQSTTKDKKLFDDLDRKIKDSASKDLKEKKEQLEKLNVQLEQLKSEVNKGTHQTTILIKKIKKFNHDETELKAELQRVEEKQQQFKEKFIKNEEDLLKLLGLQKANMELEQEQDREYKKLQSQNQQISQLIQELKDRINKIKQEIEDNQQQTKKHQEEYNVGLTKLEQIRMNYKEVVNEYDFLNDLDEIAGWKLQQQQNDHSVINISMIDGDESMIDDGRKRATLQIDLNAVLDIKVTDQLNEEQLLQFCPIEKELGRISVQVQAQIRDATKSANIQDIQEFKVKYLEYKGRKNDLDEVKHLLGQQKVKIDQLKKERYDLFMHGFNIIGSRLRETYQTLTNGGDAELELVDTMDPFSEGISFSVRPKNKSWKQMSKLSGGEKTLSSLSLIFALHYYKPTPLYFFDEVDAALDYKNVSIVANFVKERTKNAQFIVISLRNNMFELANKLIGIYKTYDMTKTISIQPELVMMKIHNQNLQNNQNNQNNNNNNDKNMVQN